MADIPQERLQDLSSASEEEKKKTDIECAHILDLFKVHGPMCTPSSDEEKIVAPSIELYHFNIYSPIGTSVYMRSVYM